METKKQTTEQIIKCIAQHIKDTADNQYEIDWDMIACDAQVIMEAAQKEARMTPPKMEAN